MMQYKRTEYKKEMEVKQKCTFKTMQKQNRPITAHIEDCLICTLLLVIDIMPFLIEGIPLKGIYHRL
jgi:hypothetical protein